MKTKHMEQDFEIKHIEERLDQIPEELEDLLLSKQIADKIDVIADRNQIPKDHWDSILEEVARVLLGITPLPFLKDRLAMRLQLPQTRMLTLSAEIDREIFSSVHHLLIPKIEEPSVAIQRPSATQAGATLADQVAQFQERKKQREAEQQKLTQVAPVKDEINPTLPQALQ